MFLPFALTEDIPCLNSESFRKEIEEDGVTKKRSCHWFRFKEERRQMYCQDEDVFENCPQVCGACCDDDPDYLFTNNRDVRVSCTWITNSPKRLKFRRIEFCEIPEIFENDVNIRDACPFSCDYCLSLVTMPPTISPVPSISRMPTGAPIKSPTAAPTDFPTKSPTKNPTDFPTKSPTKNPTDLPTDPPTSRPTKFPSPSPSDSPSNIPSGQPTVFMNCEDDPDFTFRMDYNNFPVNCNWLTLSNSGYRKEKYCHRAAIKSACPVTCNFCECKNDWDFRYKLINSSKRKYCKWIEANPAKITLRRAKYCYKDNNREVGSEIADHCTKACGFCEVPEIN